MIEVMQAYLRGEKIQLLNRLGIWVDIDMPEWSWGLRDYRVKPKKKYIPFDTAEEFLAAQRAHGEPATVSSWYRIAIYQTHLLTLMIYLSAR